MEEGRYDQFGQLEKDELIRRLVSLRLENRALRGRLEGAGAAHKAAPSLSRSGNWEFFQSFMENFSSLVFACDPGGRLLYVNRACLRLLGYCREELLGRVVFDFVHEDHRPRVLSRGLARLRSGSGGETLDVRLIRKDGGICWVEVFGIRLEDSADSDLPFLLGGATDITGRVEAARALQESEQKFRFFFERSSDPMLLLDEKGFFDCNAAALRQLKVSRKSDLPAHPARYSPEFQPDGRPSREKADEAAARAYAEGFYRFEWLHRDTAGGLFWADVSLTVIPFEQRNILFVVWRDISAFKQLESRLRAEREQLLVTLCSIGDAVITTDLKGRIVLMNRVAEQLTGWRQDDAREKVVDEILGLIDPETGERVENPLRRAISRGEVLEFAEGLLLKSRDGRQLKVADSASPIRDEKNRIIGGVLVFRDITERERMQEEVFKLRKIESVGRLAGGIAHDFNNLLTGIIGNIEIALRCDESRFEAARENLSRAHKAAGRAAELTQKLLTFAKGGEPVKQSADIAEIIRDSAEFQLSGSSVTLRLELPAGLWAAEVDAGQISQVIQNLVINAIQAMPSGGALMIRGENLELDRETARGLSLEPGHYVRITIRDQGSGIPARLHDRIFDPFFTTRREGSGLGLAVVHSIVSKHGGSIEVSSEEGVYTEFTLYLPALGRRPEGDGRPRPEGVNRVRNCRVLIMDDEEMVLEIMDAALTSYGCEVVCARDGQQALARYREGKFDLVIVDLTVPGGLGGRETVKLLREYDPGVRVVVSSGYANDPVLARYEDYGFCGRLEKPFVFEELFRLLDRVLAVSPE